METTQQLDETGPIPYDALHPRQILVGWQEEIFERCWIAIPQDGISRLQRRTLCVLAAYGRLRTRQIVTIYGKSFVLMPRHFRDIAVIVKANSHLIADTSKGLRWSLTWLPKAKELAISDAHARATREAEGDEIRLEVEKDSFRRNPRKQVKRELNAQQAAFWATHFKRKALTARDPHERKKYWFKHFRMKQVLAAIHAAKKPATPTADCSDPTCADR